MHLRVREPAMKKRHPEGVKDSQLLCVFKAGDVLELNVDIDAGLQFGKNSDSIGDELLLVNLLFIRTFTTRTTQQQVT